MAEEYYVLPKSRIVGFADQARRLSGLTDAMTPAQIEEALASVSTGSVVPDLPDLTNAVDIYYPSNHGVISGKWSEHDDLFWTDGVDGCMSVKLTSIKRVKLRMRPMTAISDRIAYIFDCRSTLTAYLLNYNWTDYVGSGAIVYANGVKFEAGVQGGYSQVVTAGEWYEFEIIFNSAFTGTMNIAKSYADGDYMESQIAWLVTYSQ
jgi:hypothetical protein